MSSFWSMGFTPAGYNKGNKRETNAARRASDLRISAANKHAERSQFLRDRQRRLYRPMEEGLAAEVTAGYNPDYNEISRTAQDDVGQSFVRSAGAYDRSAARMGLDQALANDPEILRQRSLDETATKVFAANRATNQARDRAEELTAKRGAQITALGAHRPYLASNESLAGESALADMEDYDALRYAKANADFADTDTGMAAGSSWRDGGSVTNPMRKGLKPPIEGKARRVYADGGEVEKYNPRDILEPVRTTQYDSTPGGQLKSRMPVVLDSANSATLSGQPTGGLKQPGGYVAPTGRNGGINPGGMYSTQPVPPPVRDDGPSATLTGRVGNPGQLTGGLKDRPGTDGGINPKPMPKPVYNQKPVLGYNPQPKPMPMPAPSYGIDMPGYEGGNNPNLPDMGRYGGINPDQMYTPNIDLNWQSGGINAGGMYTPTYADGGSVLAAPDTARLKNKHTEEYSAGRTDKQFGPWLEENGYALGDDNQARPKRETVASKPADTRTRTPDFLFKPLANQKMPRNYAEGGLVEEAPVELESQDFIIPADVVHAVGTVYLDNLVAGGGQ